MKSVQVCSSPGVWICYCWHPFTKPSAY